MSQQSINESNNTTIEVNDLEVAGAAEIKGGPKKIFIGGLSVAQTALPDQGPQGAARDGVRDLLIFNGR